MNGSVLNGLPLPGLGNVPVVSVAVDILEKVLAEARAGRVTSVAMVIVDPNGGVATPWGGPQLAQMYLGAGMMQSRIIRGIEAPPKSAIIPARMGG
jgi:hypothetical protein